MHWDDLRLFLAVARAGRVSASQFDDLVPLSEDTAGDDLWLVTHPDYRRDPNVRATTAFLRTAAASLR